MDAVLFAVKRAHLAGLTVSRAMLSRGELTPARFDLLYVLGTRTGVTTQVELRGVLGVARATISEMLGALESRGWIKRVRARDRRTWEVALTKVGRELMQSACRVGMESGIVTIVVDQALVGGEVTRDPFERRYEIGGIASAFCSWFQERRFRSPYPWEPEDFCEDFVHPDFGSHGVPFVDAAFEKQ